MKNSTKSILGCLGTILLLAIIIVVEAFFFMLLWNAFLVAAVTVCVPIDYWCAVGLVTMGALFSTSTKAINKRKRDEE